MTQLTTVNTNNFSAMSKLMGISGEGSSSKSSTLPRMRINHKAIMGLAEVNGKKVNMEVIEGGTFRLDMPDGKSVYGKPANLRLFVQRFMYKRYVPGVDKAPNRFIKTLMTDDAKMDYDLKDDDGGFNCGKQAGYIADFQALPEKMQKLIKDIKRVRAVFGTVELVDAVNDKGEPVEMEATPFIWEIDNRDAFKEFGAVFTKFMKGNRLPPSHTVTVNTSEQKMNNGDSYYLPVASIDLNNVIELTQDDDETLGNFINWIDNYNEYVSNAWSDKARAEMAMSDEDMDVVDDFVDIDMDEEKEVA